MSAQLENIPLYLHANVHILAQTNKSLSAIIMEDPHVVSDVTILKTRTEEVTIKYKNVVLHSLYDPGREAKRFVESQSIEDGDIVLTYGFGLGYHVSYLLEAVGKNGKVFVLEPNTDILKAAFSLVDLGRILSDERFFLISGSDEESVALRFLSVINRHLKNVNDEMKKIIIHAPSFKCLPEGFESLKNTFEMLLIERRTPQVFEKENIANIRENIDAIIKSPGINVLSNAYHNKPALFINAGPSLDDALTLLPHYKDKAVLFACDTALPALVDQDIIPDFVFSVDPQQRSADHFENYFNCGATLVFTPVSSFDVVGRYEGKKIVLLQKKHSITRHFEEPLSHKGFTDAGGSVSCIGLDVIMHMGCDPIVFVGMDYCFPSWKAYSANIAETKRWLTRVSKLATLESLHRKVIHETKVISIKNKYGEELATYQNLFSYLKHIEALLEEHPEKQFYNFLSHGAAIEGAEDIFLQEELALLLPEKITKDVQIAEEAMDDDVKKHILNTINNL